MIQLLLKLDFTKCLASRKPTKKKRKPVAKRNFENQMPIFICFKMSPKDWSTKKWDNRNWAIKALSKIALKVKSWF